jgi:hypothetical protein
MVGAVVWSKEIMATALVLPLLLALTAGPYGDLSFARVGLARFRRLAPAAIALIAAIIPVLAVVASTAPDSFARRYAATELSLVGIIGSSLMAWLPIIPTPGDIGPVVLIGVAMLLIAAGWLTVWRQRERRAHHAVVLVAALGMPVIGAIAYAPWPFYIVIYALPFLSGGALLLGQAVSGLSASGRLDRAIAAFCLVPIATFASLTAANASDRAVALHGAIATSVQRVAEAASIESVLVAVAEDQYDPRGNFGPRFPLYARMIGVEWPPVRDVTCEEARGSARRGILVLTLSERPPPTVRDCRM